MPDNDHLDGAAAMVANDGAQRAPSPARIAWIGGLCMCAAMGIGRFAFTPLLPLMQQAEGLRLVDATWLALANYVGYLVGAVLGFVRPPRPGRAARLGVLLVALSTFAMLGEALTWMLVMRFVSGVASALVMIGVAGWALAQLATLGRSVLGAWIFGSIGLSIAGAGGIVFVIGTTTGDPRVAWVVLGVLATLVLAITWKPLALEPAVKPGSDPRATPLSRDGWLMIVCYGVAGFGYIVPATFLPAAARSLVNDPAIFGAVWPVFGIAAALGVASMALLQKVPPRTLCASGILVMAIGTAAPVLQLSIGTLILSAVCVGGSFILVTLSGLQEIRRLTAPQPARGVAALTATFALGQVFGPFFTLHGESAAVAMQVPSRIATIGLVVSGIVLLARRAR